LKTDEGDSVLDPFGGSYTTGAVAEKLERRWLISETVKEYLDESKFRFE
jgi:site-specific DNA-methyltransferase (cytosine-N4-specific)